MSAIRYHIDDLPVAVSFYRSLGFRLLDKPAAGLAVVKRGALVLWLCSRDLDFWPAARGGSAASPGPGNRVVMEVSDLDRVLDRLDAADTPAVASGPGGRVLILVDPAGNPIELFEPYAACR